jgi:hypothetical protein
MPRARLALIAASVLALVCLPFVFWATRPSNNLRLVKATRTGNEVIVSFTMTNDMRYFSISGLSPLRLEQDQNGIWRKCPDGLCSSPEADPVFATRLTCVVRRTSGRLRLVAQRRVQVMGLRSFALRLRLRLSGTGGISLSPFDKKFYSYQKEVVSEPFVLP